MVVRGRRMGRWVKQVKGIKDTHFQLKRSHRDFKYNTGTMVNTVVTVMTDGK